MKSKVKKRFFQHPKATDTAPVAPHPVTTASIDEPVHEQLTTAIQAEDESTCDDARQNAIAQSKNEVSEPIDAVCAVSNVPTPEDADTLPTTNTEHDVHTPSEHIVHEQDSAPSVPLQTDPFSSGTSTDPIATNGADPASNIENTEASDATMTTNPNAASSTVSPLPDTTKNEPLEPLASASANPSCKTESTAITPEHPQKNSQEPTSSCSTQGTSAAPCSLWARAFDMLTYIAPLGILAVCVAQFIPGIWLRPSTTAVAHWTALLDLVNATGEPVHVLFDGVPAVAYSPAYAVLLNIFAGLGSMFGYTITPHLLLFGGSAVFATLLALGVWALGMATCNNRHIALAASVVTMASYPFIIEGHEASLNMAATACLVLSMVCLYLGWMRTRAVVLLALGFLLAACAAVLGNLAGALGLLLGSLFFLFWRGVFRRAGARDGAFGFALFLVLLLGWLVYMGLGEGGKAFSAAYKAHMLTNVWALPNLESLAGHDTALLVLACTLLPWLLALLFLPWEKTPKALLGIWTNRQQAPGVGWLWCCTLALAGLALCSWPRSNDALLALAPLVAVLTGRTIVGFSPLRSQVFFILAGILLVIAAIKLSFVAALPHLSSWIPDATYEQALVLSAPLRDLPGLWWLAGICAVFAVVLLSLTNKRFPTAGLFVLLLFAMVIPQPLNILIEPSQSVTAEPPAVLSTPNETSETPLEGQPVPQQAEPAQPAEMPQTDAVHPTNAHKQELHPSLAPAMVPPVAPETFVPVPQKMPAQTTEPAQTQEEAADVQEKPAAAVLPANE